MTKKEYKKILKWIRNEQDEYNQFAKGLFYEGAIGVLIDLEAFIEKLNKDNKRTKTSKGDDRKKEIKTLTALAIASYLPCVCAYCKKEIQTAEEFIDRNMRKGYRADVVCSDCWQEYIKSSESKERRRK